MKSNVCTLSIVVIIIPFISYNTFAQQDKETIIRSLDDRQREAVFKGDTALLYNLWAPTIVVNSPANRVLTLDSLKYFVRTGRLDYGLFDRTIDRVTVHENIAIVMGQELLKPQGASTNSGKTVTRRFTNIWMPGGKYGWQIVARQSTIVKVE